MRMQRVIVCAVLFLALGADQAWAGPVHRRTHPDFTVPAKLRGRVDFWIDVFTAYGKSQMIVHHRDFPQIRFGIIDLAQEASGISDDALTRLKKKRSEHEVKALEGMFHRLAAGNPPSNAYEQSIVDQMSFLPGGVKKYKQVLDNELIRTQSGIREKYAEAVKRAGRYLPMMQDVFRDYGLPTELTCMPFIESSFDYKAYSAVGAAGIWQFMRRTGLLYLKINSAIDERRDPIEATKAAARYLGEAYNKLGTWPLAITSYNHGVAGVARRVREAGTSNLIDIIEDPHNRAFGFASTNFYPEFLAALEIYDEHEKYFPGLAIEPPLQYQEVRLLKATPVHTLSRKLNIDLQSLRAVNYAISEKVWSGRLSVPAGYSLKVPTRAGVINVSAIAADHEVPPSVEAASSVYGGIIYTVRKGDTLAAIAKRHRLSVASLKQMNNLKSDRVTIGQKLAIGQATESGTSQAAKPQAVKVARRTHTVRRGDTLWDIARKYGKKPAQLKVANKMKSTLLREGQVLVIP